MVGPPRWPQQVVQAGEAVLVYKKNQMSFYVYMEVKIPCSGMSDEGGSMKGLISPFPAIVNEQELYLCMYIF